MSDQDGPAIPSRAEQIRDLLDQGVPVESIAKRLNCRPSYVYLVRWRSQHPGGAPNWERHFAGKQGG